MPDDSIQTLLAELQENPDDWTLRARVCDAMLLEGRIGEAASLIETAPNSPDEEPHILKAVEVYSLSQPEKAVPLLYGYLQVNPSSALAHLAMAETAFRLEQLSTARSYYQRAVELSPGYRDPDLERKLGVIHQAPGISQPAAGTVPALNLPTATSTSPLPDSGLNEAGSNQELASKPLTPARQGSSANSGIPGWVFTALFAVTTFLLCWMLLALALRASVLQAFPEP